MITRYAHRLGLRSEAKIMTTIPFGTSEARIRHDEVKPKWDRQWGYYRIRAVFAEKPEQGLTWPPLDPASAKSQKEQLQNWDAYFFQLPNPLLIESQIKPIVTIERGGKKCRIYPPFPLNEKGKVTGLLNEVKFPEEINGNVSLLSLPQSAVKGATIEPRSSDAHTYCHALRFDVENGFGELPLLKALIDQLVQYTNQWWLVSPESPFRGPALMCAHIDKEFHTMQELRYSGAGDVPSPWYGMVQTQMPLGLEKPLTEQLWLQCLRNIQGNIPAEIGLLTFNDAIAQYMAGEDERCILNLCVCFEILASKRLLADTGKTESKNKKSLDRTTLAQGKTAEIIGKLIIDRDHVSHGRPPHILRQNPDMMKEYLEAICSVVNRYLQALKPGEWPQMTGLTLSSTRKR